MTTRAAAGTPELHSGIWGRSGERGQIFTLTLWEVWDRHKLYLSADIQVFLHFNSSNTPQKPATYQSTSWTRRTNTSTEMNTWLPGVKAVREWLRWQNLETSCHGHVLVLCFQMRDRYAAAAHLSHTLKHNWWEESFWMTGSNNHWKMRPEPVRVFIYTVKLYNVIFNKHSAKKDI